jgi:transcriptional regulator
VSEPSRNERELENTPVLAAGKYRLVDIGARQHLSSPSMYRIKQFEVRETSLLLEVIEKYPLASLVAVVDGLPQVTHLPLTAENTSQGQLRLCGHMSRRNPIWMHIRDGSPLTIVFQGPHAYINPSWYVDNDVPTWNYVVVEATGKAGLVDDYAGLIRILKRQTAHMNRIYEDKWDFFLPSDLQPETALTAAIVGFEMEPDEIAGKFKLSQNRPEMDQRKVVEALGQRRDEASRALGEWMSKVLSYGRDK